jgi:hypothetical protein
LKPQTAPVYSKRSFAHPDFDNVHTQHVNDVKDWTLLRSLHREKQKAKLQDQIYKREAKERDMKLEYTLKKEELKQLEDEKRRQKYILSRGLRSTFEEAQKALNDMTEVELKAKQALMYY